MRAPIVVFLLLIFVLLVPTVSAYTVTIETVSLFHQPLEGCFVILNAVDGTTDQNGTVVFQGIESGNYSLRVVSEGKIINSSVLVEDGDTKKTFSIMTGGDWQLISFFGLAAVGIIAVVFLLSRMKLDKREPYGSKIFRGKKWGER